MVLDCKEKEKVWRGETHNFIYLTIESNSLFSRFGLVTVKQLLEFLQSQLQQSVPC